MSQLKSKIMESLKLGPDKKGSFYNMPENLDIKAITEYLAVMHKDKKLATVIGIKGSTLEQNRQE